MKIMLKNNILRCNICNKYLIFEELQSHNHSSNLDNIWFDTDGTYSFDGKKWYKFSPTENKQRNKTPDDSTEPKNIIVNITF
jgi:hypothetical protein